MADNPTDFQSADDWHDRLIDRALREQLGGETPPDLSAKIVEASARRTPTPSGRPTIHWRRGAGLIIAASLLLGFLLPWQESTNHRRELAVRLPEVSNESQPPEADFDALVDLIQTTTEANGWRENGQRDAQRDLSKLRLEISQSQTVNEEILGKPTGQVRVEVSDSAILRNRSEAESSVPQLLSRYAPLEESLSELTDVELSSIGHAYGQESQPGQQGAAGEGLPVELGDRISTRESILEKTLPPGQRFAGGQGGAVNRSRLRGFDFKGGAWYDYFARGGRGKEDDYKWKLGWRGSVNRFSIFPDRNGDGVGHGGDRYDRVHENPFIEPQGERALSTFSIDVDTASYANMRQFLNEGQLPPADAVRIEELINYFDYDYQPPADTSTPFAARVEVAGCPWQPAHRLVRIGVKGRELQQDKRPLTNLVFLIDVSGSMNQTNKHPLVIAGLKALVEQLGENDRVAIVVYASQEGLALPSTPGDRHDVILSALDNLRGGGSTAGGAGIQLAYQMAEDHFITGGVNRVILCTDGDFNVGATSTAELERLVASKAKETGVFLSVCGFGRGNLNDAMMETISGRGNGEYYYVDSLAEAEKVFVKGLTSTLVTIAKDVKIQVEFNPAQVAGYRLIGYENRVLAAQDFNDDKKDAGEIGAGHTVTALYEVVPTGVAIPTPAVDDLKYQQPATGTASNGASNKATNSASNGASEAPPAASGELLTLKMRYKQPTGDTSSKLEWPVTDEGKSFAEASTDLQFAASVAGFGMLLRNSQHAGDASFDAMLEIAESARGEDAERYREEFVRLIRQAKQLSGASLPDGGQGTVESAPPSRR